MKIIAIEHEMEGATSEAFALHLTSEAEHVWALQQQGIIREIYFRVDRNEAVLVLECDSVEEAESLLSEFPLVKNRLIRFELIPVKAYSGFERLFEKSDRTV